MLVNRRAVAIEWGDCDPAGIVFYPRYFAMFDASTAALFAHALGDEAARSRLERYFADFRQVGLEISGDDLAALGLQESPRVGAILDELLRRKLNGELDGRESEIAAAKELIAAPAGPV